MICYILLYFDRFVNETGVAEGFFRLFSGKWEKIKENPIKRRRLRFSASDRSLHSGGNRFVYDLE